MTRSQDQIVITNTMKEIEAPSKIPAIMPGPTPPHLPQPTTDMPIPAQNASTRVTPITNKENISVGLVPFEPNFDDDDDLSDMDILSAICGVPDEVQTTISKMSNVLTNIPKAMFANCQIGSINITFAKKIFIYTISQKKYFKRHL